jgi:hypothetical protein
MRSLSCGGSTAACQPKLEPRRCLFLTRRPYQEEAPVSPLVEFGHHAVDDVRFWRDDVYSVHVSYGLPPLFDALDVWDGQHNMPPHPCWSHTCDVEVEDVIFLDHVVYELLAVFVHDEDLPLCGLR